jgi:uncharacterized protein (TIGR02118 family)
VIHVHYFICRKPGMDEAEFHRHWRDVHGPIASAFPRLRLYVQSHRIPFGQELAEPPFDGVAEVLVDDEETLQTLLSSDGYQQEALADERDFIDMDRAIWLHGTDHVIFEAGPIRRDECLVKAVFLIKRKPGISLAAFRRHWKEVNGRIAAELPGLRRLVQSHALDSSYESGEQSFDGAAHLWTANADAMAELMASRKFREELCADGAEFIDPDATMSIVAEEQRFIWPE